MSAILIGALFIFYYESLSANSKNSLSLNKLSFTKMNSCSESFNSFFENLNYQGLIYKSLIPNQNTFVDQIFINEDKIVLLKFGFKSINENDLHKIRDLDIGYAYNDISSEGIPYSLFFSKISLKEINLILQKLTKTETARNFILQALLGDTSWATENKCSTKNSDILLTFGTELNQETIREIAWTCSTAAGNGFKSKFDETLEFVSPENLIKSSSGIDLREFWGQALKTYEALQVLVPQLAPMMKELSHLTKNLHPTLKINLICSAIGSKVFETITPGGVIKQLVFLKSKIEGLQKFMSTFKILSKLYDKYPKSKTLDKITKKVGACAI